MIAFVSNFDDSSQLGTRRGLMAVSKQSLNTDSIFVCSPNGGGKILNFLIRFYASDLWRRKGWGCFCEAHNGASSAGLYGRLYIVR